MENYGQDNCNQLTRQPWIYGHPSTTAHGLTPCPDVQRCHCCKQPREHPSAPPALLGTGKAGAHLCHRQFQLLIPLHLQGFDFFASPDLFKTSVFNFMPCLLGKAFSSVEISRGLWKGALTFGAPWKGDGRIIPVVLHTATGRLSNQRSGQKAVASACLISSFYIRK